MDFPAVAALQARGAEVSAMAMDLGSGQVMQQLNGARRLTPASVSKLYVAAAALDKWGPDHRFTTQLLSRGKVRDGVLHSYNFV